MNEDIPLPFRSASGHAAKPDFTISFERLVERLYSIQLKIEHTVNSFVVRTFIRQPNLYRLPVAALDCLLQHGNLHDSKNLHAEKSD